MSLKGIFRGVLIAFIILCVVLLGAAAAVYFGLAGDRAAGIAVFAGAVLGVFAGAFIAAKVAGQKKLFNALAVSFVFAVLLIAAAFAVGGGVEMNIMRAVLLGSIGAAGIVAALIA